VIIISAGIPKSGTAWYFNLTNDLLVAAGAQDAREIQLRYHLQSILLGRNCLFHARSIQKFRILVPSLLGNTFAIKVHGSPGKFNRLILRARMARSTLIYRDPRDIAVSLFDHAERLRQKGKYNHPFAEVDSIDAAIWMAKEWLLDWDAWKMQDGTLMTHYEDLVNDPVQEMLRLRDYLHLDVPATVINDLAEKHQPGSDSRMKKRYHFNRGKVGRYKTVFTAEQDALCRECFSGTLERMGYQW